MKAVKRLSLAALLAVTLGVVFHVAQAQTAQRMWGITASDLAAGATTGSPLLCSASGSGCVLNVAFSGAQTLTGNLLFSPDNTYDIGASLSGRPANVYVGNQVKSITNWTQTTFFLGASASQMKAPSDGVFTFLNAAGTDFTRLQFGGTTSAFPSWKRSSNNFHARLADDSAYTSVVASQFFGTAGIVVGSTGPTFTSTIPTFSAGFGTSPSLVSGTATAFRWNVGTGAAATTGVITIGATATTGWNCVVQDLLNTATHQTVQTASTTTTASFAAYSRTTGLALAWTSAAVLAINCTGF